jgi:hypothetical protein
VRRLFLTGMAIVALAGCATIFDGRSQQITVNTDPPGASCKFERKSILIGKVASTPGELLVEKTKDDILITCDKDGYETAAQNDHSGADATTAANILLLTTFGIGWAIDSATGADNKYDSPVSISMTQKAPPAAQASQQ